MEEPIDIIDKFFAEHPAQLKPIRTKLSHLHTINNDRSLPLKRNRKDKMAKEFQPQSERSNVIKFDRTVKKVELIPRNTAQEEYIDYLLDDDKRIVVGSGSAGTGKTYLATKYAIKCLQERSIDRIVITRPMVEVDEEKVGFLPGTLLEKVSPWLIPILDVFEEHYSKDTITQMIEEGKIEICPLGFMRGRSIRNSIIILDEGQNASKTAYLMLLTRIASGSKVIITGDTKQIDKKGGKVNGLVDLVDRLIDKPHPSMAYVVFNKSHVERDQIVQDVLEMYDEE